jgi:GT2 family glycosyltransferase
MELSVIIVSYNVRYFLEQCLLSVQKASENIECEIFVVDNNSADGSCSMISGKFPEVKLIMNNKNRGFAAANNQALKIASGRYILLLNPDTLVEETTFTSCIKFMDEHPEAGATGVRMINGKGKFLPESKRAFPGPRTAFFKIFGLSHLFPKSEFFNNYYLGHLDQLKTSKADVITGAFMFLRREAVLKTGLLDEDFFMYGEDIDYSYRLIKAGYTNYYYPETRIIHYKGESTKKGDLNAFVHFYRAMTIFVKKHLSNGNSKAFFSAVRAAVLFRAALSLFKRILKRISLPLTDAVIIYFIYLAVTSFWQLYKFGHEYTYPGTLRAVILPVCTAIMLISLGFAGGYKIPSRIPDVLKGLTAGIVVILITYALLPAGLRFSRAVVLTGGLFSLPAVALWRLLTSLTGTGLSDNPFARSKRTIIIADKEVYKDISGLMSRSGISNRIAGRVSLNSGDMSGEVLGSIGQLREVIRVNRIKEVIFSTKGMSASQIINLMNLIADLNITAKIASACGEYIIGSRYISTKENMIQVKKDLVKSRLARIFH